MDSDMSPKQAVDASTAKSTSLASAEGSAPPLLVGCHHTKARRTNERTEPYAYAHAYAYAYAYAYANAYAMLASNLRMARSSFQRRN
eukprot:7967337-Karenia_brevis.AAC.1